VYSSWAVGGGVGPVIGGSLAQSGHWYAIPPCPFQLAASHLDRISFQEMAVLCVLSCVRFQFSACREPRSDLNLPICVFNATLVLLFMRLKTPHATLSEKLSKIDFV
jgi:hypothetical protein